MAVSKKAALKIGYTLHTMDLFVAGIWKYCSELYQRPTNIKGEDLRININ
jgi:hypothetical protein